MKKQLRRMLCFLCALILTVQLCPMNANSVLSGVCLIAVGDDLMEPKQETMPFWQDGRLYVPETVFKGIYKDSLDVVCAIGFERQAAVLYRSADGRYMAYELKSGKTYDNSGYTYPISAIEKNGYAFFPLTQVTEFFNLTYSYTPTDTVPLLRIKSDTTILDDQRFIDAARNLMRQYYTRYEKEVLASQPDSGREDPVVYKGQWVYPVLVATESASSQMLASTLYRREMQATFLLTPRQMEDEPELLRALVGMKQGIGILPDPESDEPLENQLERANAALWAATRSTTRMVWPGEKPAWTREELEALGYCSMACILDYSDSPTSSSPRAESVYKQISGIAGGSLTVFLGNDTENLGGISRLLTLLNEGDCRVLAWRETL